MSGTLSVWCKVDDECELMPPEDMLEALERGADPNEDDALSEALRQNSLPHVQHLIEYGARLGKWQYDRGDDSLLYKYLFDCSMGEAGYAEPEIIELLLDNGEDARTDGLLHFAEDVDQLSLLVDAGADIDQLDHAGNTLLHTAAYRGDVLSIKFLLQRGADLFAVNSLGQTAEEYAYGNHWTDTRGAREYLDQTSAEFKQAEKAKAERAELLEHLHLPAKDTQKTKRLM